MNVNNGGESGLPWSTGKSGQKNHSISFGYHEFIEVFILINLKTENDLWRVVA